MKYRISVTACMLVLIALLFGGGSAYMIHSTYENLITQEQQEAVRVSRMLRGALLLLGDGESGFSEESLTECLRTLSAQMNVDGLILLHGDEVVFQSGSTRMLEREVPPTDDGIIRVYYRSTGGIPYVCSGSSLMLGEEEYRLGISLSIEGVHRIRRVQLHTYVVIFGALLVISVILLWLFSTILIRPMRQAAEAKDSFMGAFTHELKTPMTSMIGYASLLQKRRLPKENESEALSYLYSEAKRLEHLSHDLLTLFELQEDACEKTPTDIAKLAVSACEIMRPKYDKYGITLLHETQPGLYAAEPELLRTLILNLLDNACKAMDHEGSVLLRVRTEPKAFTLLVTDEGRGMDQKALKHLTEAFYRVDKARSRMQGGVGLGLSICERIARLHNGTITFESRPGVGTTVRVRCRERRIDA